MLRDDQELCDCFAYVPVAFTQSDMSLGLLCHIDSGERGMCDVAIGVSPEGATVLAGERCSEVSVTCNVQCERGALMSIIRGEVDPMNALMSGQVTVDDLGQLMAFKIAFSFNRAAFNAFLDERRRLAGATI